MKNTKDEYLEGIMKRVEPKEKGVLTIGESDFKYKLYQILRTDTDFVTIPQSLSLLYNKTSLISPELINEVIKQIMELGPGEKLIIKGIE